MLCSASPICCRHAKSCTVGKSHSVGHQCSTVLCKHQDIISVACSATSCMKRHVIGSLGSQGSSSADAWQFDPGMLLHLKRREGLSRTQCMWTWKTPTTVYGWSRGDPPQAKTCWWCLGRSMIKASSLRSTRTHMAGTDAANDF